MKRHLVAAFLQPPLATLEFGYISEIFGDNHGDLADRYDLAVCAMAPGPVDARVGLAAYAPSGLELLARADTIMIPSWDVAVEPPAALRHALQDAYRRGARLISIGSGAFVLAEAGLLDGRRATTHWSEVDALAARCPKVKTVENVLYVEDGNILTCAGQSAGLDMLLHVIRQDHGPRISNAVARRLVAPPRRAGHQAQLAAWPVPESRDTRLTKVIDYLRLNTTEPHRTSNLAAMAAMSPRSFSRKFRATLGHSPYEWLLNERVIVARELLEESDLSIDQVSADSGFSSTQSFRTTFRRILGVNPAEYKRNARKGAPCGQY